MKWWKSFPTLAQDTEVLFAIQHTNLSELYNLGELYECGLCFLSNSGSQWV